MTPTVDGLDPLASPDLIVPDIPEPSPSDFQPFMGGLSPGDRVDDVESRQFRFSP